MKRTCSESLLTGIPCLPKGAPTRRPGRSADSEALTCPSYRHLPLQALGKGGEVGAFLGWLWECRGGDGGKARWGGRILMRTRWAPSRVKLVENSEAEKPLPYWSRDLFAMNYWRPARQEAAGCW